MKKRQRRTVYLLLATAAGLTLYLLQGGGKVHQEKFAERAAPKKTELLSPNKREEADQGGAKIVSESDENKKRDIASLKPPSSGAVKKIMKERELLYPDTGSKINFENLIFTNTEGDWESPLRAELSRFHSKGGVEVKISPEAKIIDVIERENEFYATLMEKVRLEVLTPKERYTFRALINSETGSIVKSWDRDHLDHETHPQLRLKPLLD